jgi:arginine:ornithine antiporter/lysine permease
VVGALAVIYTAFLLFAAGPKFILVSFIIDAPASILFVMTHREQASRAGGCSHPAELVILAVSIVGAIVGVVALATGWISI